MRGQPTSTMREWRRSSVEWMGSSQSSVRTHQQCALLYFYTRDRVRRDPKTVHQERKERNDDEGFELRHFVEMVCASE